MSKKRKRSVKQPDPVAPDAWKAWLADPEGTAPLAQPEQAMQALRFVAGEREAPPDVTGSLAQALVDLLAEAGRHPALLACAEQGSAELSKLARKTIFALRRQGVDLPEPRPRTDSGPAAGATGAGDDDRRAAMSSPGPNGQVLFLLRLRGTVDRRLYAAAAALEDTRGLVNFTGYVGKSRLYGRMVRSARERTPVAEVPFDYAVARLHEGAATARAQGRILSDAWAALRPQLPPPPEVEPPHPAESLSAGAIPDAEGQWRLFEDPVLSHLMPDLGIIKSLGERISEVLASKILIDDAQRAEQIAKAVAEHLAKALGAEDRSRWERLLLDAAWVAAGERKSDLAGTLVALRDALRDAQDPASLPFFRQLFMRAFVGALPSKLLAQATPGMPEEPAEGADKKSVVWTPDDEEPEPRAIWRPDDEEPEPGTLWTPAGEKNGPSDDPDSPGSH